MKSFCALIWLLILPAWLSRAGDWPQYRGPNGDGFCSEIPNLNWPAGGPKVQISLKEPFRLKDTRKFNSWKVGAGEPTSQVDSGRAWRW